MLAKIIVGAFGLLVLGAGGYAYWQGLEERPARCSGGGPSCHTDIPCPSAAAPCCDLQVSVQQSEGSSGEPETLTVAPREAGE